MGREVVLQMGKTLYGLADVPAAVCSAQKLRVVAAPVAGNANHANVIGWPSDKPAQKAIAQELAAVAKGKSPPGGIVPETRPTP